MCVVPRWLPPLGCWPCWLIKHNKAKVPLQHKQNLLRSANTWWVHAQQPSIWWMLSLNCLRMLNSKVGKGLTKWMSWTNGLSVPMAFTNSCMPIPKCAQFCAWLASEWKTREWPFAAQFNCWNCWRSPDKGQIEIGSNDNLQHWTIGHILIWHRTWFPCSIVKNGFPCAGVILMLHRLGHLEFALVLETRPYNQGSRLTSYELQQCGVPFKLIPDNAVSWGGILNGLNSNVLFLARPRQQCAILTLILWQLVGK